jgi:V/A-type H+-transporting ATPase subunit I
MSIERMKRIWVVVERERLAALLDFFAAGKSIHLAAPRPPDEDGGAPAEPFAFTFPVVDLTDLDARVSRLGHVLEAMNSFVPPPRSFGENFVSFPLEVTSRQMREALEAIDVDKLDAQLTDLADEHMAMTHRMEEIEIELARLGTWSKIGGAAPTPFRQCTGRLGTLTARNDRLLRESEKAAEVLAVNELGRGLDNRVLLQVVALNEDREAADELLRDLDFTPLPLTPGVSVRDMLRALGVEYNGYEERTDVINGIIRELTRKHRDQVTAVLGWWEAKRGVLRAQERSPGMKRLSVVLGYVRARDAERIAAALAKDFPEAGVTLDEPTLEEQVPVELRTNRFFAPAQFLTGMFGVPSYRGFDPSPFIMFNFLVFFGFCFGDVVYGLALILVSLYIARRVKAYSGLYHFFTLLAWGGVSTMIVGALTGAWASDLWQSKYLGEHNLLKKIAEPLMIGDPMAQPVIALLVALGIGVLNQFYGIVMKIYMEARRRNWAGACFDGGLWLVTLPGLLMLITGLFSPPVPAVVSRVGLWVFVAGVTGLILTQGRKEKGIVGKAIVGLVSCYGILGSYGSTAFIGDTLSYCRLLALGLTTTIVGMCFNIIAGLARDIPYAGLVVFVLVLLVGHTFNFLISCLGAFVHSARLIFLEFFGRFYEIGGLRFEPLGTSPRVRVIDEPA